MEISESVCTSLLDKKEIFSAHLIMKIMRGDFIIGRDGLDHWISLLKDDDVYIVYRFFYDQYEEKDDIVPNKHDIRDVCSMLFYTHEGRDGTKEEIDNLILELEIRINREADIRGLSQKS